MKATTNRLLTLKLPITLALALVLFPSCASHRQAYERGLEAELSRDYDQALGHYEKALSEKPGDIEYRLKVEQSRFAAAFEHYENGRRAMEAGDLLVARAELTRATQLDPTHSLAKLELQEIEKMVRSGNSAETVPQPKFEVRKELARIDPNLDDQLQPTLEGPISIRISQEAEAIFETVTDLAGLNVIFDPEFRSAPISVDLDDLSIYDALDILALQTRTFWRSVNQNTIIIVPDNQQKRREYEQHILKTIYLTNSVNPTDITEAITAIRTLLNMRFVAQSTSMNAIILRDTPDKVAIAEKIIDDIDMSKPEVLVEATILEVDRNRLRELGILPPQGTTLQANSGAAGTNNARSQFNLRDLDAINSGSFNIVIPDSVARFLESDSRTKLVQNPSVRATDGKLAQIRIGSRVPVASGSFQPAFVGATGTPVVQFQYIDVGVNLDITPRVLLNRQISMNVLVQVQATAGNNIISGVALPVFTNRSIQHEIRLDEGETNILGGLITDTESTSFSGIPGLSKIPILKHLFGAETRKRDQTEIIILIRPHIVKMPNITDRNLRGLMIGTETNTSLRETSTSSLSSKPKAQLNRTDIAPKADPSSTVEESQLRSQLANVLRFDPTVATLDKENETDLDLHITGADITGIDLTIDFDPIYVEVKNIKDGGFLSQDGAHVAIMQNIDTSAGQAQISIERSKTSRPLSGEGRIMLLSLQGVRSGRSAIQVTDFKVRGANGEPITGMLTNLQINVP